MGKKNYYCEYCQKSFKDILGIRKNHLKGLQHQKAVSEHYAKFKDLKEIFLEESRKKTCKRIFEGLECKFGTQCRFSHYTPGQLAEMKHKIAEMEASKKPRSEVVDMKGIEKFLNKTRERILRDLCTTNKPFWTYPFDLVEGLDLPPSLQPLEPSLLSEKFEEWG
ncbi:zinc finger matrin-type protein 5 [Phlebotomus papatasi]|uniref:zinc finger matrin-type protein 5 n=1 Tax=Phlebotomus papatasi TaxID=29031 RepID=UPI002483BD8E|nr:zinc finger matrin-type protein 5 [Phlebotomus papatasi]